MALLKEYLLPMLRWRSVRRPKMAAWESMALS